MHFRYNGNTSLVYSVFVHRDIEVRIGLTARQAADRGLGDEDVGHTLEARASIDATRIVRNAEDLLAAIESAEATVGRRAADRLSQIDEIVPFLWPDGT
jgi:hypothetical protein